MSTYSSSIELNVIDADHVLEAMVRRIADLKIQSWDRSSSPHENNLGVRHKLEHWFAYLGSSYSDPIEEEEPLTSIQLNQERIMQFASFVKVVNVQNDSKPARKLHQIIMWALNGYLPTISVDGLKSPILLKSDSLLPPTSEETTFRYQAIYHVTTGSGKFPNSFDTVKVNGVNIGVYVSEIEDVGNPDTSIKDVDILVNQQI
jgi:hypothetical protein